MILSQIFIEANCNSTLNYSRQEKEESFSMLSQILKALKLLVKTML